ncbi:MAG TPA: heparan-alpha-glucosaminide N-acetyltransferase domain-containing protein [Puia sp.]|nr:heparan-alpha-glucosaminide N-acetyltransferase domain-containing protein [Puia sp.]
MNTLTTKRITSIDLLRGLIMIIMALDHVRDYFHADAFLYDPLDLNKTTVALYFTRWITHFCAPIFVLLAGTSAFLSGQRKTKKQLSFFLLTRGIWLMVLEETVVNFEWFYNIHFNFFIFGVIWVLGLCMVILAGLIFLPRKLLLVFGLIMVAGHNLLDKTVVPENDTLGFFWGILHQQKFFQMGQVLIAEFYHVIPWVGVMTLGYCLGGLYAKDFDPVKRRKILLRIGVSSWILFIIIRSINVYGDLYTWTSQASPMLTLLSFLNVHKYPPSLDYLLVTEGFAMIFLSATENVSNRFTKFISVYGRVPMFYYLCHLLLIHLGAMLAAVLTGYHWYDMVSFDTWITELPRFKGYGFSLGAVYLIWIALILILYPLCRKYDSYKSRHKEKWWLSYL